MRRRLIIDTDAKNEADDQFAIVHALPSPSLDIAGIVPAHFGDARIRHSMQDSRDEVDLLLRLLDRDDVVVANGAEHAVPDPLTPVDSDGARLIISEARKPGPLFVIFLGPLTDMASALLLDPSIADNPDLTVVWIGGTPYDEATGGERRGEVQPQQRRDRRERRLPVPASRVADPDDGLPDGRRRLCGARREGRAAR